MRSSFPFAAACLVLINLALLGTYLWRAQDSISCVPVSPTVVVDSTNVGPYSAPTGPPLFAAPFHHSIGDPDCCLDIAHAGGSYLGRAYTNSLEALERNYGFGRRVFEIDFAPTCDGAIVLAYDWDYRRGEKPNLTTFRQEGASGGLTVLTLSDLVAWMAERPDTLLVTDTKFPEVQRALRAHLEAVSSLDFLRERVVFQVYSAAELRSAELAGHARILTIYKMGNVNPADLVELARGSRIVGLTIPERYAVNHLETLRARLPNLAIYVHGAPARINSRDYQAYLVNLGASGFYQE